MDLRIFIEPQQGATYEQQRLVATTAESLGFSAFFRSDHYLKMGDVTGLPGPSDSWVTLAGLARDTSTIRLGTLVTSATFRLPGPLAIAVAEVDAMSNGRVELGLGAGWFEAEHMAYAIPFPEVAERFDRFEEQLAVITGLWATPVGTTFSYTGTHYQLTDSPALPKPTQQPRPPIIIGGHGPRRTPALAARYADEFNQFAPAGALSVGRQRVEAACEAIGRDPATMIWSAAQILCCGQDDTEAHRRADAIGRTLDELRPDWAAGSVEQVTEHLGAMADAGVDRVYLQVLDLDDLDHLALVAERIAPALR